MTTTPDNFKGWPSVFYVFGTLGCVWYMLWMMFFSSSPSTDKWITDEERKYIESTNSSEAAGGQAGGHGEAGGVGVAFLLSFFLSFFLSSQIYIFI